MWPNPGLFLFTYFRSVHNSVSKKVLFYLYRLKNDCTDKCAQVGFKARTLRCRAEIDSLDKVWLPQA